MAARGSQISKSYRILSNSRLSPPIRKHGLLLLQGLKTTVFNTIASSCSGLFLVLSPGKLKHWWLRGKDGGRRDKVAFLCDLRVRARKYHLVLTVQSQVNINVSVLLSWYCETSFLLTLFFFFLDSKCPLANFLHMVMYQGHDKRGQWHLFSCLGTAGGGGRDQDTSCRI